ncbi:amine oxidase, flavin-containing family protein [Cryptosporidium serpentis]
MDASKRFQENQIQDYWYNHNVYNGMDLVLQNNSNIKVIQQKNVVEPFSRLYHGHNYLPKDRHINGQRLPMIDSCKPYSYFTNMMKKGLICFSCGNSLNRTQLGYTDGEISTIPTCSTSTDISLVPSFVCRMDLCGRAICYNCKMYAESENVILFNTSTRLCTICYYQSNYNINNMNKPRNPIEWHWSFQTADDLTYLRQLRTGLVNGHGLHIELSGRRQGCWRRRKEGIRKHFSFKQYGGFFESRMIALDLGHLQSKAFSLEYKAIPFIMTLDNDSKCDIIPKRMTKEENPEGSESLQISNDICHICFKGIMGQSYSEQLEMIIYSCNHKYCNLCLGYIESKFLTENCPHSFFNKEKVCIICHKFKDKTQDNFKDLLKHLINILPCRISLIKLDIFNMEWKTPYASFNILGASGILDSRLEAYKLIARYQRDNDGSTYDRSIFYGEFNSKVGYYTQFIKNGVLRIYGPYDSHDEAGRRWDLDALKYYGAEDAMTKAYFPKLLTWLSLPEYLQRYFLAPWIVWTIDKIKDKHCIPTTFISSNITKCYDVIVIGAGVAGMRAAELLLQRNLQVIILEAQNMSLGRACSYKKWPKKSHSQLNSKICYFHRKNIEKPGVRVPIETIELCNELLKLSVELLEEVAIDIYHPLSNILDNPIKIFNTQYDGEYTDINPSRSIIQKLGEIKKPINWRWLLINHCIPIIMKRLNIPNLSPIAWNIIKIMIKGDYDENLNKGIEQIYWEKLPRFVGFEEAPWREYWCCPNDDTNQVSNNPGSTKILNGEIEVNIEDLVKTTINHTLYNKNVTDILYNNETDQVNVRSADGTWYRAICVLCTLPIGVLKGCIKSNTSLNNINEIQQFYPISNSSTINFSPLLPSETINSIESIDMNNYTEVYLTFDNTHHQFKSWYPILEKKIYNLNNSSVIIYINSETPGSLVCGISQELCDRFSTKSSSKLPLRQLVDICLELLRDIVTDSVELILLDWSVKIWKDDEFTRGSIPVHTVDSKEAHIVQLIKPHFDGHLYFAGDGTTVNGFGTVNGALLSAKRATTQICQFLDNR